MAINIEKVSFDLPKDLVFEILLILPVKTLVRFKSVCKAWYGLIQNPIFVEKHRKIQTTRERDPTSTYILVTTGYSPDYTKRFNFLYFNDTSRKLIESDTSYFPDMKSGPSYLFDVNCSVVVGISNGLVCMCSSFYHQEIIVFNPTIRQLRQIPPFEFPRTDKDIVFLGFVSHDNDYELIRIVCSFVDKNKVREIPVLCGELYTKSTDTWREIEVKLEVSSWFRDLYHYHGSNSCSEAVLIKGVFYWQVYIYGHQFVPFFDIHKGVFDVIRTPMKTCATRENQLYEINDKLALVTYKQFSENMWILNENLTWTNVKIDFSAIPDYNSIAGGKITVLGSTKNEKLVLERRCDDNLRLFLYDINSRDIKILHDVYFTGSISDPCLYTPALTPVT